ncbi:MAG TPA: YihY/virulence factor BrkB family protein [Ktedonobacteraceae bacterium]|nr:YihY/virulence factor BrkB family protein [Ktedonobacteraceae bacterium]
MEASNNTPISPDLSSQTEAELDETTIKLPGKQQASPLLLKAEQLISPVFGGATKPRAQTTAMDGKEQRTLKQSEIEKLVISAEEEARHVLREAETHEPLKVAIQDSRTFGNFWQKCMNDWMLNFASGLAYSLLMAMFPIVIALAAVVGFIAGDLNHAAQHDLITQLNALFPTIISPHEGVLDPALTLLHKNAGFLSVLAILLAIFSGSRLFVALEDYFDIIYHTAARTFWRQNLMAIGMLLIFILLIPIMLFASSVGLGGLLGGLVASWLLFEAIYMVVPNQHISLRNSWLGALVAALALQVYVAIFPFYVRNFLGSYNGNAGFAVILLLFFYYFAVILLIGAEVNAFYAEGIRRTPDNLAGLVHKATLATDKRELADLAHAKAAHKAGES